MAKVKTTGANIAVPQDDSECRAAIRELGDFNRERLRLQAEMNDKIAAIQQEYGARVEPINDAALAKQEGIKIYCEANRNRLTKGGKIKTHAFSTGDISWRLRPAKVTVRGKDAVIAGIKAAGLKNKFLRTKEELNKDAMLEKGNRELAAAIKGITIGSDGEDFIVEPNETDLKEAS